MTTALLASPRFQSRLDAGKALACSLEKFAGRPGLIVLGMPRGGVTVARVVADALGAPLDVVVARKLGVPGIREVALGAVAEGLPGVVQDSVGWYIGVSRRVVRTIAERERRELDRRVMVYREGRPLPELRRRTVIVVDDGLATGATARAAVLALRQHRPARIIVAAPVASPASCAELRPVCDEIVVVATPEPFETVSASYGDFSAVEDADVLRLLGRAYTSPVASDGSSTAADDDVERTVAVPLADAQQVAGDLGMPNVHEHAVPRGLVILAHGGGSSRNSYRNRFLAGRLRMAGWATLRLDLLLDGEQEVDDETGDLRFDVARLASRLDAACAWAVREGVPGVSRTVLFGASTGAAAAAIVAAERRDLIQAVVARGGRVDLAADALTRVAAPVFMVVGSADRDTLELNRSAAKRLARSKISIVRGAGHTFEEPGALGAVGERVAAWLDRLARPQLVARSRSIVAGWYRAALAR